jgi:hypothetical protein
MMGYDATQKGANSVIHQGRWAIIAIAIAIAIAITTMD